MSDALVQYHLEAPAVVLTMNRPDKRNALSRELIAALIDAFRRAGADPAARCVILTGAGTVFCAGMDLIELAESFNLPQTPATETTIWNEALRLGNLFDVIYTLPKPTIAAVNGAAAAGGAGLVTVCDLALAVPHARIGYPEVRRGLVAAMVMPHLLRHVGERAARHLLLTGELMDAAEAFRVGLVNAIVHPDQLLPQAHRWCRSLAEGGPMALASTKALLERFSRQALSLEETAQASAAPRLTEECKQGLRAFFAKQPTPWAPP